jgi:hypothetical protein
MQSKKDRRKLTRSKPDERGSNRRLEFKLSIGFVHPGGLMLGWFMGQMMEPGFRPFGSAN